MKTPLMPSTITRTGLLIFMIGFFFQLLPCFGSKAVINSDGVLVIDGAKVFPIGFTMPPPLKGKAPNGKNGIQELADTGATFLRTGPPGHEWGEDDLKEAKKCLDVAAKHKMHVWVNLRENSSIGPNDAKKEKMLRTIVSRFKDHPGMGTWKGVDEPEWEKHPIPPMERAYQIIHEIDPHHPVVLIHAPRGTFESLKSYNHTGDIVGTDIYPVAYPPGLHSGTTNRELSMVGNYAKLMVELADGKKGVWMTLQIAWSGVLNPGKTLRFPTFPEQRFMVYDAIINGTRGLIFFGGALEGGLSREDRALGWNWTFWNQVQKRVVEEIGRKSPLHAALMEPNSSAPVKVNNPEIEFCVRETGNDVFLMAAKKTKNTTVQVEFTGLPVGDQQVELMFESPRTVNVKDGKFSEWFAPYEVHVYRFKK